MSFDLFLAAMPRLHPACARRAEEMPGEAPLWHGSATVQAGPFLEASIPNWAALMLEDTSLPRAAASQVARMESDGHALALHVMQAGTFQLRTLLSSAGPENRALLTHAKAHGAVRLLLDIHDTVQSLASALRLHANVSTAALQSPATLSMDVGRAEVIAAANLTACDAFPSLLDGHEVRDVLVLFSTDFNAHERLSA